MWVICRAVFSLFYTNIFFFFACTEPNPPPPRRVDAPFHFFFSGLDILKDGASGAWSPALTMRTVLMSLQALMCCPEPKDPQDAQVARQYLDDRKAWEKQARFWTETYAGEGAKAAKNNGEAGPLLPSASSSAPHTSGGSAGASAAGNARAAPSALPIGTPPQFIEGVKTIMEMGFSGEKALEALKGTRGNVQAALERLM